MRLVKIAALSVFVISGLIYVLAKTSTYSISYENYQLQEQLTELSTNNDELQIQLTTNLSRTELMEKYPDLQLYDNIFYIEEES
ncbi:hypothetical protein R2F61_06160 [Mollicutes bacterium LVI A0078]|nr:hypothetical protein RZE84_06165 [Mollicutes bacterium LVI A0075]WOO90313.1 hypothetical protein R2F61_06160 [Mollicutes bacterium LVI A0078]